MQRFLDQIKPVFSREGGVPPARSTDSGEEQRSVEPRLRRSTGYQLGCMPETLVPMGQAGSCQGQVLEGWAQVILIHTKGKLSGDGRFLLGIWRQPPAQLYCIACHYGIFSNFPQDLRVKTQLFLITEPFGFPASLQDVQFPFVSGFVVGFWFFLGGLLLQKQIGRWRLETWRYIECEPLYTVKKKKLHSRIGLHLGINPENAEMTHKSDYFFVS